MKKIPNWLIVLVILGLLIGSKFLFFNKKEEPPAAKGKSNAPIAVNYYVVKPDTFNNDVFATGKIGAFNQIQILPEVSGKVISIYFNEGETVTKGSLMVKLNDADLQAQLLKAKTQMQLSELKLERLKKLIAINGISQEELDAQENELSSFKADQAYIAAQIAKTNITAPFTGVVGLKNISEGSFVSSQSPIASLVQVKPLFVEFSVPEKYSTMFTKGIDVRFSNDNQSRETSELAKIYAIEPMVDENTKTIRARAMYSGKQDFYPGSFVKVYAELGQTKSALMVPTQCVIPTLKGQKVFVVKNNLATEVQVTIGVRTDTRIQVIDGLQPGDTIVTTGLLSVKKETPLKLLKASK
jgi:membrane fusion protein (multidrug efflux system)